MVLTPSIMSDLGKSAPPFALRDTEAKKFTLDKCKGKHGLLVAFICNHCPYVKHVADEFAGIAKTLQTMDIGVVGINSNDTFKYPDDSVENMAKEKAFRKYTFPYLWDADQKVAKAYQAACTPDFFLYNENLKLFYRGQLDDSRPGNNIPVTGKDLMQAVESMMNGKEPPQLQKPSIGCNIKWFPGNEPDYFGVKLA